MLQCKLAYSLCLKKKDTHTHKKKTTENKQPKIPAP